MRLIKYTLASIFGLFGWVAHSQIPTDVPNPSNNTAVDFSEPANIIVFIVLPVVIAIFILLWYRQKQKDKTEQE